MGRWIIIIPILGILYSQELPYGKPKYFDIGINEPIHQIKFQPPSSLPKNIFDSIKPIEYKNKDIYLLKLILNEQEPVHFKLIMSLIKEEMSLYFIDLNTNGWVGPYSKQIIQNNGTMVTGQMKAQNILIELSIPRGHNFLNPIQEIISPITPKKLDTHIPERNHLREPSKKILLCGYWPPSNECIRPFSTNATLNPDGWIGQNWEGRGFDVVSYFPTFGVPDCDSCGQGFGDFEVDYQDTSEDWWNIVDSINPVAIITFSRGYIDYSWELESQYVNYFYWTPDFTAPYYPTPAPPDSTVPVNTRRYSSLPMDSIVSKIESSGLELTPYIDYTQSAGDYLSGFMGYHGTWYKAQMDSVNIPCYLAGHVHLGGLIDWDTARQAAEITLREVIKIVIEYQDLPGDINEDGVVSILDMLTIVSYLLGIIEMNENELYLADINFDSIVDIFDLMLISNIILDY